MSGSTYHDINMHGNESCASRLINGIVGSFANVDLACRIEYLHQMQSISTYHLLLCQLKLGFKVDLKVIEKTLQIHDVLILCEMAPFCSFCIHPGECIYPCQEIRL